MIIDGKKIAEEIIAGLGDSLRGKKLGIVVNAGDPATESFVKIKERVAERLGVEVLRGRLDDLQELCDVVLVQLPHPEAETLLLQLWPAKDVDALGDGLMVEAPVVGAVREVLRREGVGIANKKAVVIGEGRLVGKPVAEMLRAEGALLQVVTLEQGSLAELKDADIIVSGAGSPHLIKPDMLKPGVVLIDAGTSEQGGKVVGDVDPACAKVASVFTPVPGGMGPIAVAKLFQNFADLIKKNI
ncbi:MAG: FolD bifunctional protein methylenetetrahydrofolate dehydrogenase [Candidatus Adlerbacteria bacterium]|nr:FolD bifunctional protein methylenetetrahydrofolate dehydrogenase [Candidatus Adlerbacteria bacterium]